MLKQSAIRALAILSFLVLPSACGGNGATPTAEPTSPPAEATALPATATRVSPTDTAVPPATEQSSPEPQSPSLAGDGLPTIEVVKKLKPSVVQIVTEVAAMGAINQAVPSMGVGTGV